MTAYGPGGVRHPRRRCRVERIADVRPVPASIPGRCDRSRGGVERPRLDGADGVGALCCFREAVKRATYSRRSGEIANDCPTRLFLPTTFKKDGSDKSVFGDPSDNEANQNLSLTKPLKIDET